MGVKSVINALYDRKKAAGLALPPHGAFDNQSISSKPQNISGAIGGPRRRIVARMPAVLGQTEAELHRYLHGGSSPRWRQDAVGFIEEIGAEAVALASETGSAAQKLPQPIDR